MNMRKLSSIFVLGLTLMTAEHAPAKEQTVSFLVEGTVEKRFLEEVAADFTKDIKKGL